MATEIPLTGGLVTQADPEEVTSNACTVLTNADFTKYGAIRKRKGRGSAYNTGIVFVALKRWYNPNIGGYTNGYYWVGIKSDGTGHYSFDLTTWYPIQGNLDVGDPSGKPFDGRIYDYNSQLRFSADLNTDAQLFQHIDRKFFWSGVQGDIGFQTDIARPRVDVLGGNMTVSFNIMDEQTDSWFVEYASFPQTTTPAGKVYRKFSSQTIDISNIAYFYKYSLVFDGNQESELSDVIGTAGISSSIDKAIPLITFTIDTGSSGDMVNWNERITAINVYRSTNSKAEYKQIGAISTVSPDSNIIKVTDAVKGSTTANSQVYISGLKSGHAYAGKTLRVNGLRKLLGAKDGENGIYNLANVTHEGMANCWGQAEDTSQVGHTPQMLAENNDSAWDDWCAITDGTLIHDATHYPYGNFATNFISGGTTNWDFSAGDTTNWQLRNNATTEEGYTIHGQNGLLMDCSQGVERLFNSPAFAVTPGDEYYVEAYFFFTYGGTGGDDVGETTYFVNGLRNGLKLGTHTESTGSFEMNAPDADHPLNSGTRIKTPTQIGIFTDTYAQDGASPQTKTGAHRVLGNRNHKFCRVAGVWTPKATHDWAKVQIECGGGSANAFVVLSGLTVSKLHDYGKCYGGLDVYTSNQLGEHLNVSSGNGRFYQLGTHGMNDSEEGWVQASAQHAIRIPIKGSRPYDAQGVGTGKTLVINDNYWWQQNESNDTGNEYKQSCMFADTSLANGVDHPTQDTSLNTKYKYSKYINGRNFVGNVKIENEDGIETHPNWVMFSEMSKPDVIPIANYIQLADAQGGEIIGLANLLGDLAVFMNQGIFRLSIPSTEPTAWSLRESEANIGCITTESITEWEGGVFFAGHDHLYYLDSNFRARPVTTSIKEVYQEFASGANKDRIRTAYEPKKEQLHLMIGDMLYETYILDLSRFPEEHWSIYIADDTTDLAEICVVDENSDMWSYDASHYYIRKHDDSNTEKTLFQRRTGWIKTPDLDTTASIRRLNLRYLSGDDITIKIYTDGDTDTAKKTITIPANTSGDEWYKTKPGVRCKYFMIDISTPESTNDVEIRRMEVGFE